MEGGLDLRKAKKEEERVCVLVVMEGGRRVEEDCEGEELAAIEHGRSPVEKNSRASGDDCRKCWS